MVSLNNRLQYIDEIKDLKLIAFSNLIFNSNIVKPDSYSSPTEKTYYALICSIVENNKKEFEIEFKNLSKRKPTESSPFIHDDFLIFSIIIGLKLFKVKDNWLIGVIVLRSDSEITTTFLNLLREDLLSSSNLPEIVICYLQYLNLDEINDQLIIRAIDGIHLRKELISENSNFLSILAIRSLELSIILKENDQPPIYGKLKEFEKNFLKRSKKIAWILSFSVIVILCISAFKFIDSLPKIQKDKLNDVGLIIGIFGLSVTGLVVSLRKQIEKWTRRLLGYNLNKKQTT